MESFKEVLIRVGIQTVADVCGITGRAVYKWHQQGSLPRTEYTNETMYAFAIATIPNIGYTAKQILEIGKPTKNSDAIHQLAG